MTPVVIAALLLILDQVTKFIANHFVEIDTGVKSLIPGILQMVNLRNEGGALAFLTGNKLILLVVLAVLTAAVAVLTLRVVRGKLARTGLLIFLAGVLGNGLDHLIFGYVTDMFELLFLPNIIFNLADVLLGLGAVLFAIGMFTSRGRDDEDEYDEDEDEDDEDDEDDEEDERPRRRLFGRRRDDDDDEDEDEDEDEPVRRASARKVSAPAKKAPTQKVVAPTQKAAAPVQKAAAPAQKAAAPVQKAAAPAQKAAAPVQKAAAPAQKAAAPAQKAAAPTQKVVAPVQKAAAPVQKAAAPVQRPVAPVRESDPVSASDDEFDLDSILNEFK